MYKEEKTILILLAMASLSLAIAYLTFFPENNQHYKEYTDNLSIGEPVQTSGTITQLRTTNTGGHLIIHLKTEHEETITIFIPKGAEMSKDLETGDHIRVCGKLSEYKGKREILADANCLQKIK